MYSSHLTSTNNNKKCGLQHNVKAACCPNDVEIFFLSFLNDVKFWGIVFSERLPNKSCGLQHNVKAACCPNGVEIFFLSFLIDVFFGGVVFSERLPKSSHKFLHYRWCKQALWDGCEMERTRDLDILRFKSRWVQALSKVPLRKLMCGRQYASDITKEAKRLGLMVNTTP